MATASDSTDRDSLQHKPYFTFSPHEDGRPIVLDGRAVAYLEEDADEALGYAMAASQKSLTVNQHALDSMLMLVHHIESAGDDANYYARLPFMVTARERIEELGAVIAEATGAAA